MVSLEATVGSTDTLITAAGDPTCTTSRPNRSFITQASSFSTTVFLSAFIAVFCFLLAFFHIPFAAVPLFMVEVVFQVVFQVVFTKVLMCGVISLLGVV